MSSCSDVVSHMSHLNKRICIAAALTVSSMSVNINLLYKRLGHPAIYTLKSVLKTCNPFADIKKSINSIFSMPISTVKVISNTLVLLNPKPVNHYNFCMETLGTIIYFIHPRIQLLFVHFRLL